MLVLVLSLWVWQLQSLRIVPVIAPNVGCATLCPQTGYNSLIVYLLFFEVVQSVALAPFKEISTAWRIDTLAELAYVDSAHTLVLGYLKLQVELLAVAKGLQCLQTVHPRKLNSLSLRVEAVIHIELPQPRIIPFHVVDKDLHKFLDCIGQVKRAFVALAVLVAIAVDCFHKVVHHAIEHRLVVVITL